MPNGFFGGNGVSGCFNHVRSLKQNMAYRRHTHSFHCRSASISGCLWALQRQPEKQKSVGVMPSGFLLDRLGFRLSLYANNKQPEKEFNKADGALLVLRLIFLMN
nr:hypothetical protein [uncultured Kingella sp.]